MTDIIILAILIIVLGLAIRSIIKAKKNGSKCIGCPYGGTCSSSKNGTECNCLQGDKQL